MSEQLNEELGKLISKAAIDGTLSKSAVKQFNGLVVDNENLRKDVTVKTTEIQNLKKEVESSNKHFQETHERLSEYLNREKELADRESQAEVLAMTVKYEQKRVEDHKEMVGLVFRNTVLRKQVMTPLESGVANQYNSCPSGGFAQKDEVEETEA